MGKLNFYNDIKYKFLLIYLLNITDIIFTFYLINTGDFYEGNFFMKNIINNEFLTILTKGVCVLFLIIVLLIRLKQANLYQLKVSKYIVTLGLITYMLINISHIFWIVFTIS